MVHFFGPLRHITGIVLVAVTIGIAPASATENSGIVETSVAVPAPDAGNATRADASGNIATPDAVKADIANPEMTKADVAKTATATADPAARRRPIARRTVVAASQHDRRAAFTRAGLGCSGVWCGRHYVLMLGIGY